MLGGAEKGLAANKVSTSWHSEARERIEKKAQ
jgi:hypothetical protein